MASRLESCRHDRTLGLLVAVLLRGLAGLERAEGGRYASSGARSQGALKRAPHEPLPRSYRAPLGTCGGAMRIPRVRRGLDARLPDQAGRQLRRPSAYPRYSAGGSPRTGMALNEGREPDREFDAPLP